MYLSVSRISFQSFGGFPPVSLVGFPLHKSSFDGFPLDHFGAIPFGIAAWEGYPVLVVSHCIILGQFRCELTRGMEWVDSPWRSSPQISK